jgi:hypothetical protein
MLGSMTSALLPPFQPAPFTPALDRRLAGAAAVLLVHAALVLIYLATRHAPGEQPDGPRMDVQWIALPTVPPAKPSTPPLVPRAPSTRPRPAPASPAIALLPAPPAAETTPAPAPVAEAFPAPEGETILEKARRSAGRVDRALRSENRPYIVAPLDSPQMRMRSSIEKAHALAPPKLWEAPKVEELVNQTGDGVRRTRVITARGTRCITERSPVTNVEMIDMHGKLRLTNCPQHEDTATQQVWRTARD